MDQLVHQKGSFENGWRHEIQHEVLADWHSYGYR